MLNWLFPETSPLLSGRRSASLENPSISLNDPDAVREAFGMGGLADSGEDVSHARAVTLSPVWKAVKMISGDCSKIPLETFTRRDEGGRELDVDHWAFDRINPLGKANDQTTALQFWRFFFTSMLLWENGYAWIDRANDGRGLGLYNLLPDRTCVQRIKGRKWVITEVGGGLEFLPYEDCLHVPGLTMDGVSGCDMVLAAREEFGQALAARKFTSRFFKNGLHLGGVIMTPGKAGDGAQRKIEKAVNNRGGTDKAFRTLVLEDGFKFVQTMANPQQAMLVDLNEQKIRDVANYFMLWPGRLGMKDSISYNSIEQERKDYFDTTLSYHLTGVKAEVNIKLLTDEERRGRRKFIDYNINALLWADAAAVANIAYGAVDRGIMTPDEARALWNWNPLPNGAGKDPRAPLNTAPVKGDASSEDDEESP